MMIVIVMSMVVTMMRMIVVVMRMIMVVMRMVVVIILVDGDDGDGGGCQKVRAPSCKELCEKKKVLLNIFNLELSKTPNNHD